MEFYFGGEDCPKCGGTKPKKIECPWCATKRLEQERDIAQSKYNELCLDIAEWHPMDECAQELHTLRAQVKDLAEALECLRDATGYEQFDDARLMADAALSRLASEK